MAAAAAIQTALAGRWTEFFHGRSTADRSAN